MLQCHFVGDWVALPAPLSRRTLLQYLLYRHTLVVENRRRSALPVAGICCNENLHYWLVATLLLVLMYFVRLCPCLQLLMLFLAWTSVFLDWLAELQYRIVS